MKSKSTKAEQFFSNTQLLISLLEVLPSCNSPHRGIKIQVMYMCICVLGVSTNLQHLMC